MPLTELSMAALAGVMNVRVNDIA